MYRLAFSITSCLRKGAYFGLLRTMEGKRPEEFIRRGLFNQSHGCGTAVLGLQNAGQPLGACALLAGRLDSSDSLYMSPWDGAIRSRNRSIPLTADFPQESLVWWECLLVCFP